MVVGRHHLLFAVRVRSTFFVNIIIVTIVIVIVINVGYCFLKAIHHFTATMILKRCKMVGSRRVFFVCVCVCVLLSATIITVQSGWFDFPAEEWADVSPAALGFIRSLLRPDPLLRMTADEALEVSDTHL